MRNSNRYIAILGPTASGKTQLAIKLAKKFNGEVVCADSRTIYKGLDIGTAKPTRKEQSGIKHHMLDIITPDTQYSVAAFKETATSIINEITARGKLAFLVGGSGLYIDSVLYDYAFRNSPSRDEKMKLDKLSLHELQELARHKYPVEFNAIDTKNRRRVEQLITMGPAKDKEREQNKVAALVLGIDIKKPLIKQNIALRTKQMLHNEFIQEVNLLTKKYGHSNSLMLTTGYAQVLSYLDGKLKLNELEAAINTATWQLAKKQLTWFKRNKSIIWVSDFNQAQIQVEQYLATSNTQSDTITK